ncbi:unnamed protein product, partial [Staurois parvus]
PISASQCRLSVPPISAISATYQCPSVQPISAHHCSLIRRRRKITYLQKFMTKTKKKLFFFKIFSGFWLFKKI